MFTTNYYNCNYDYLYFSNLKEDIRSINKSENKFYDNKDIKMLSTILFFINKYVTVENKKVKILYINALPDKHLVKLLLMYPFLYFDIYVNYELDKELVNNDKVNIYKKEFTIDEANLYKDNEEFDIYIITDHKEDFHLRNNTYTKEEFKIVKEKSYEQDMKNQYEFCKLIKPKAANLIFRPPKFINTITTIDNNYNYFNGEIITTIFNSSFSNSSRLIINNLDNEYDWNEVYKWNLFVYTNKLNYYNNVICKYLLKNPFTNDNTPLPNQIGNKFEYIILFMIIRDYYISIQNPLPSIYDVLTLYTEFFIKEKLNERKYIFDNLDNDENDFDKLKLISEF